MPDEGSDAMVIGVDFGTLSARALVVRASDGKELGSASCDYPHGVMDRYLVAGPAALSGRQITLPPDWALQAPGDYIEVLKSVVPRALADGGVDPAAVVAIGVDFTSCTMVPTTADGTPLSELANFADRPHAYVKLWKHHAAQPQADRINAVARERGEPWLARYGGLISSEWQFAKALQLLEEDPHVYAAMDRWVEAGDWMVWQLTGKLVRNACAAGYKGIYQDGGYPSREFSRALNPDFEHFADHKLAGEIGVLGARAGGLTNQAAGWAGLREGIPVAVGNVDAHVTAPAANACGPGQLSLIMGTSTCHVVSTRELADVPGICGAVDNGIVDGLWGYEAGQSGSGDIFQWFVETSVPPDHHLAAESSGMTIHGYLTELAARQRIGEHGLLALDWHSGNRSVLVDHELAGLMIGTTLTTRPEDQYRALLEATAFGTRKIIETFLDGGVPVDEIVVAGGLLKNPLLMQIYADVTRLPLSTIGSEQGPALGSAIHAAVAAGIYPDVRMAARRMGRRGPKVYLPDQQSALLYDAMYADYLTLHDYYGRGGNDVMRRLRLGRRESQGA